MTVLIDGKTYTVGKDTKNFDKIVECLKNKDYDNLMPLIDPRKALADYTHGTFEIKSGEFYRKGVVVKTALSERIISMYEQGFPIEPMVLFIENLYKNPSKTAVDELYGFLEENNLPITDDGHFIAYRRVTKDYKDCYTKTIDNSVGQEVSMERHLVEDNRNTDCAQGLHFASMAYLTYSGYGGYDNPIMLMKINPADVVSIPKYYKNSKGRCCKYVIIGEVGTEKDKNEIVTQVESKTVFTVEAKTEN